MSQIIREQISKQMNIINVMKTETKKSAIQYPNTVKKEGNRRKINKKLQILS